MPSASLRFEMAHFFDRQTSLSNLPKILRDALSPRVMPMSFYQSSIVIA